MALKKEEIQRISQKVLRNLKDHNLIKALAGEDKIVARIEAAFQKNIDEEAAIDSQARKLIDQHQSQMAPGTLDTNKAFNMIKKQIAKERKFIL